jgi:intracellular septation protein
MPITQLYTFLLVLVLGGATIYFRNDSLIKWKFTILNWIFGTIFIFSSYFKEKPVVKILMEDHIHLPSRVWKSLNNSWGVFFIFLGTSNMIVACNFSTDFWINFKLFGMLGLTITFILFQGIFIQKYLDHEK